MRTELRNLCTFISGGDKPSIFSIEKTKTCAVPVYANAIENDGLIGYTNKYHVEGDTVTIAARGSGCGFVSYRDDAYTPVVRLLCLIPNRTLIYPKYLYYLLKCNKIRSYGSGQPQITIPQIADFVIEYDDNINNQKKIADFLWNIELKIKINNRINDNLQQLLSDTFSYWFKQFQFPNNDGKAYKSNNGQMKWSDELKTHIPYNWEVKSLKDILIKNSSSAVSIKSNVDTIDLSVMPSDSLSLNQVNNSINFTTNLFEMNEGDLLFGSIRPYLHKAGIAPVNGYVAGTVHSYRVIRNHDYNLALSILTSKDLFNFAVKVSTGTKMPIVSSDNLLNFKFAYSEDIAKLLSNLDIKSKIISNIQENIKLQQLRDFLLPLLMNGQVSIV